MKNLLQLFLHRYTKRGVVSLFALLFASVLLPLQAQDLSVFDGDTISLSYDNRYVTATSSSTLGASTTLSLGSLWRVHLPEGSTSQFRLENIGYEGYYLQMQRPNFGNTPNFLLTNTNITNNAALLSLGSTAAATEYAANAYCSTSVIWTNGGRQYYIYTTTTTTSGLTASTTNNNSYNIRIEKWQSYKTSSLSIQPVDFGGSSITPSITFPFVDTNADAAAQARTVDYQVAQTTTEYIAAIAGLTTTRLDSKTETTYPTDAQPSVRWQSHTDTISYMGAGDDRVHNNHALVHKDYPQTLPDTMIHVSKTPTLISSTDIRWQVTVTPIGKSPLNLMQNDSWIDYQDSLIATVTYGGNTASHSMAVTRTAGRYTDVTALDATITPYYCYFDYEGKTLDGQESALFHIDLTFRHGLQVLGKDNNVLLDKSTTDPLSLKDLTGDPTFSLRDRDDVMNANKSQTWWKDNGNNPTAWNEDNNTLTVTLPENGATLRQGMMLGLFAYTYTADDGVTTTTYRDTTQTLLVQRGTNQSGSMSIEHQPGAGGTKLNDIGGLGYGMQDVHSIEKTIYYIPDSIILLPVNEGCFYGYWRWYDYELDRSAFYDKDGNLQDVYRDGIDDFKWIGTDGDDIPKGIYLTNRFSTKWEYYMAGKENANSTAGNVALPQPSPTIHTWADGQERYIACDISNYTDYEVVEPSTDNNQQGYLKEPTLSYRQIFHLLPAKDMADSLSKCIKTPYETHSIMAPIGKPILLSTDFAHHVPIGHHSELCYFFYGGDGKTLCRVGKGFYETTIVPRAGAPTASHMIENKKETDFIQVESKTTGTYTYDVVLPKGTAGLTDTIWLAHFEVEFVDPKVCGPSTETLIDNETILSDYLFLAKEDFNYGAPETAEVKYYNQHLPWGTSTYGYAYPEDSSPTTNRKAGNLGKYFPFYGEYCLLNKTDGTTSGTWLTTVEQRGGAENGYCMYADGTQRPGLVAVVETSVNICSGQQLYCSAWLCNPANASGTDPRFLIKVQGRNKGEDWETIQQIMTGEIEHGGEWHQVNLPLKSTKDYAESRVAFYNFASNNSGNDFMIDDIYLYASHIPIQAFQATTSCVEDSTEVIIIRIDYTTLTQEWAGQQVLYQIYDDTDDKPLTAHYYREGETDGTEKTEYGYINVPAGDYRPSDGESYSNLTVFVNEVINGVAEGTLTSGKKGYISITEQGKTRPVFYMAEVVRKDQLLSGHDYFVRVGSSEKDLADADCARTTPLVMKPKSELVIGGESSLTTGLCANNRYPINVLVSNQVFVGNTMQTIQGEALADWLVAYAFDDCYLSETDEPTDAQKEAADEAFQKRYGATRGTVTSAIQAMRSIDSPNRLLTDASKLVADGMDDNQVALIKQLVGDGRLILGQSTMSPYLTSQDTARYWVFPIQGTATATDPATGEEKILDGCEAPQMIRLCVDQSKYVLMLGPLDSKEMGEQLPAGSTPGVRVSESEANHASFSVEVGECGNEVAIDKTCRVVETNDPQLAARMENGDTIRYTCSLSEMLTLTADKTNKDTMRAGYEYTLCIRMYDNGTLSYTGEGGCEVGYSYVVVKVLPETLVWTPTVSIDWSDDRNWRARSSDGTLMDYGYAPISSTDVVIPAESDKGWPCITGNNLYPADSHYSPHACRNIRFCAGAKLLNQHLLDYNRAFVDMTIESALWHAVSTPLMDTYSGDFFIPHSGTYESGENLESKEDFEVAPFAGTRTWDAAYTFYVAYYNHAVEYYAPSSTTLKAGTADFVESNTLTEKIGDAQGFGLQGWGPGEDGETLTIRLPKGDTQYSYWNNDTGEEGPSTESIGRPNPGQLVFPSGSEEMQITLTNTKRDKNFLFGNPTMAYINMSAFLEDNSDKVETTLMSFEGSSIAAYNVSYSSEEENMLPPMRAIMLTANSESETLSLTLKAEHLTTGAATAVAQQMPRMRKTAANTTYAQMNITAYTPINDGATKAEAVATAKLIVSPSASNGYVQGEDAPFLSSGVETESYIVTPLNLYTLAGEQSLALDVRNELKAIPLGFVIDEDLRSAYSELVLAFSTSLTWDAQCYLCDTESDMRIPLCNDLQVRIPMPTANHELRYYIEGPAYSPAGPDTPTSQPGTQATETAEPNTLAVISNAAGSADIVASAPMEHVRVYDVAGRTICDIRLDAPAPMLHLTLPSGVAIVEATLATGETLYQKAYVR